MFQERAAGALANLAADDECSTEVAVAGGVHALVMLARNCKYEGVQEQVSILSTVQSPEWGYQCPLAYCMSKDVLANKKSEFYVVSFISTCLVVWNHYMDFVYLVFYLYYSKLCWII